MKIRAISYAIVGSLCLLAASLSAEDPPLQIQQLMEKSGLNAQIAQIPTLIQASILQTCQQKGDQPELAEIYREAVAESFDPSKMKKDISASLEKSLGAEDLKSVLVWLDSPLGRKITAFEKEGSTPAAVEGMKACEEDFKKGGSKLELVKRLNTLRMGTEVLFDMSVNAGVAMTLAMMKSIAPDETVDIKAVQEQTRAVMGEMKPRIEELALLSYLNTFRKASDEELSKYVEFCSTGEAIRYHKAVLAAFREEWNSGFSSLGESIGKKLKAKKAEAALPSAK